MALPAKQKIRKGPNHLSADGLHDLLRSRFRSITDSRRNPSIPMVSPGASKPATYGRFKTSQGWLIDLPYNSYV